MIGDIDRFKTLITQRTGLMLEGAAEDTLRSAVAARMTAGGFAEPGAYLLRLLKDDSEFHELVNLLTINETYFFREPDQLAFVFDRLIPRLLSGRGSATPIRVLSAGCSSGEEPYSIAMGLRDRYGDAAERLFTILGADIDHTALARARAGLYGAFSFRGTDARIREKYFAPVGRTGFSLNDCVRRMVSFHHLNLRSDRADENLTACDVILFRNVSIYFDTPTRKEIQHNLARLMGTDAALLVGVAETLANDLGVFRQIQEDGVFYFTNAAGPERTASAPYPVKPAAARPQAETPLDAPRPRARLRPSTPAPASVVDLAQIRKLIVDKRFDAALAALAQILADDPDNKSALLLSGYARLQNRDFAGAENAAQRVLDLDPWNTEAGVLLGFAAKWRNAPEDAVRWFKQAVYAKHDCWVAQYYLAEAYRGMGNADAAKRAYRVALQHLTTTPDPDGGLSLPLGLPVNDIRFLCERQAGDRG